MVLWDLNFRGPFRGLGRQRFMNWVSGYTPSHPPQTLPCLRGLGFRISAFGPALNRDLLLYVLKAGKDNP